jgi:transposase
MAPTATTRGKQATACTPTLFLAFELGVPTWQLGGTTGAAPRPRERHVPAGDGHTVLEERRRAQSRLGLPEEARGVSGDAAGREGFGLHRCLRSQGVENAVVDSASIAVHRRYRRATTDRLDVPKVLTRRRRHTAGAQKVWSVVRVPSGVADDRRPRHRELLTPQRARTRVLHRSTGLLAGYGMRRAVQGDGATPRDAGRPWDGTPLPSAWCARLKRAWQKVQGLTEQSGSLAAARRAAWRPSAERVLEQGRQWATLRGLGVKSAGLLVRAFFAWRAWQTPKQVGA